jgi:PAS domain S-box-containing protein
LRDAREHAKRTGERIQAFGARLRLLSERSAALAQRAANSPPSFAEMLAELSERENELADVNAELRRQFEELLQARQFLERERARSADLFDSAPDAYVETDARGVMREANHAAAAFLAHPQELLIGKLLIAFVARGDTRDFRRQLIELGGPEAEPRTFEIRMRPRGGTPLLTSVTVRGVRGTSAHRWTLRAIRAGAVAAPQDERIADTLTLAIHELRSPLTAMLGWLQMIRDRVVAEPEREGVLAALWECACAQRGVLDDLSELAQLRAKRGVSRSGLMALREVVSEAVDSVKQEAVERRIDVVVEQVGAEPLLEGDASRARRAVAKMLLRVLRSMADGSEIRVRILHSGDAAMLELYAPGARWLGDSRLELTAITECLAADGGRLVVPASGGAGPLCVARWTMGVPSWRKEADSPGLAPAGRRSRPPLTERLHRFSGRSDPGGVRPTGSRT